MNEEQIRQIFRDELSRIIGIDRFVFDKKIQILDARNIQLGRTTGTKIGTETGQKIAFHNATPVVQASHIANPGGGLTADSEARTAINAILVVLENKGFIATS